MIEEEKPNLWRCKHIRQWRFWVPSQVLQIQLRLAIKTQSGLLFRQETFHSYPSLITLWVNKQPRTAFLLGNWEGVFSYQIETTEEAKRAGDRPIHTSGHNSCLLGLSLWYRKKSMSNKTVINLHCVTTFAFNLI